MKILICFPDDGETGQAIIDGCKTNGYEVDSVDSRKYPEQMYGKISEKNGKYDICLMARNPELFPSLVRAKIRYPEITYCVWNVDERDSISDWQELNCLFEHADYYFTLAEGYLPKWRHINPNSYFLPQGAQIEKYHDPGVILMEDRMKYQCEVSFIGPDGKDDTIHTERYEIIEYLRNSDIDFKNFTGVWGDEHNIVSKVSMINIGMAHSPQIAKYHSVRDWKIMAAGGVLLTRYHPGYDELYNGYAELFLTKEECLYKIKNMLLNYDIYRKRAEEAQKWVVNSQCYSHRIQRMVEIINDNEKES